MVTLRGMAEDRFGNVYFSEKHTPLQRNGMAAIPKNFTKQNFYLFSFINRREQDRTLANRWYKMTRIYEFLWKNIRCTYFMTEHKQKVNKISIMLICIPFLLVLGYLLVEWFSLTQSSMDGVEDDGAV